MLTRSCWQGILPVVNCWAGAVFTAPQFIPVNQFLMLWHEWHFFSFVFETGLHYVALTGLDSVPGVLLTDLHLLCLPHSGTSDLKKKLRHCLSM